MYQIVYISFASHSFMYDPDAGPKKMDKLDLDLINTILPWRAIVDSTLSGEFISNEKILEVFKAFRYQLK